MGYSDPSGFNMMTQDFLFRNRLIRKNTIGFDPGSFQGVDLHIQRLLAG